MLRLIDQFPQRCAVYAAEGNNRSSGCAKDELRCLAGQQGLLRCHSDSAAGQQPEKFSGIPKKPLLPSFRASNCAMLAVPQGHRRCRRGATGFAVHHVPLRRQRTCRPRDFHHLRPPLHASAGRLFGGNCGVKMVVPKPRPRTPSRDTTPATRKPVRVAMPRNAPDAYRIPFAAPTAGRALLECGTENDSPGATTRRRGAGCRLSRDSPDAPGTGVNIGAFPAFLQGRREVRTATSTSGSPHGGRGSDLAIFAWHWDTPLPSVALGRMPIEHVTLALVVAAVAVPR